MNTHRAPSVLVALFAIVTVVAACGGGSGPLGTVPPVAGSPEPSVAQGSPDLTPAPSADASDEPSTEPSASTAGSSPNASPTGTTVVRAYFWLDGAEGVAGLVAVLREVPATKAVATAAVNALLAGPMDVETSRHIETAVPDGSQLLGLSIAGGVATVDLSADFEAGGATAAVQTRLGQVVYTLTQFPSIRSVVVQIEGADQTKALGRADFASLLPVMWVDRPAWGASIGNPAHVTGSADVFEATFRIAILDGSGKVIADQQVMATCGTGCTGTFDTTIPYAVAKAQYGTLRVYDRSAQDGSPENIRDYRVWLTPKS